ncbi:MAG: putative lipid II flippase FtsW [Chitinophagales bacterium]
MRAREGPPDFILFIVTLILLCIGLIMVSSASAVTAGYRLDNPYFFMKKQVLWVALGIIVMIITMRVNYEKLRELSLPAIIIAIVLLLVVFIPGVGKAVKGSTRQIYLGLFNLSPSELAKVCMVLFMSSSLARHMDGIKDAVRGLLPHLILIGLICGLVMMQPDLGTTFIIAVTAFVMLSVAGARWEHMALMAMVGVMALALLIYFEPYRMIRFTAFLNPWKYPTSFGFQTIQSLYALGSGGIFGVGLGLSRQKFFYLPEQHTDFIFAILGEELGYLGVLVVLTLFLIFAWRGIKTALNAPDAFGSFLAVGATSLIIIQAMVNIGVVSGALPVTGIPLPFISYGGSSLVITMISVGLLLNVSRYARNP